VTLKTDTLKAVDGISFQVKKGEIVGYLGPNGAGKSTTIKMLTGLLVPSAGEVKVNGFVPWKEREHYVAQIGAVFGQRSTLWWDLPVSESLDLLQHIYKIPKDLFTKNLTTFIELLDLGPFLHSPVRSLSLGQRMRADICAALLHNPEVLFLDEPTIGLDVVAKERIRSFIKHINKSQGTTVILTTHDLADVQKLCQRIMIIDHGKLLFDGHLNALQNRFGGKRQLIVDFSENYQAVNVASAQLISFQNNRATYEFDGKTLSASELITQLSQRYQIQDLAVQEPDIEATIREIYEKRLLEG
jgi:ABC-2 type transport system ATP-binding protein